MAEPLSSKDLQKRYDTYKFYVMSINLLVQKQFGFDSRNEQITTLIRDHERFQRLRPSKRQEILVGQLMRSAWSCEVSAIEHLRSEHPVGAATAVPWAFVKMYYMLHDAFEAFFLSSGMHLEVAGTHSKFLGRVSDFVTKRPMFPEPWSGWAEGSLGAMKYGGLEFDAGRKVSNLARPSGRDCSERVAQILRTTHSRRLKEKRKQNGKCEPTTLMHFLYRLRTSSNYRDVDPYLFDLRDRSVAEDFREPLLCLIDSSMMMVETLVSATIGAEEYQTMSGQFVNWLGKDTAASLYGRKQLLAEGRCESGCGEDELVTVIDPGPAPVLSSLVR